MPRRDRPVELEAADNFRAACFDTAAATRRAQNLAAGGAVRRWRRSRAELVHSARADLLDAQAQLNTLISIIEAVLPPAEESTP